MAENGVGNKSASSLLAGLAILFVLVLAAFLAIRAMAPPKVVAADASAEEFSAERAFSLLKDIAARPHPMGTPAHDEVREAILRIWRGLGFTPEVRKGLYFEAKGEMFARVENILVRLPGTKPAAGGAVMLATHYDSVSPAPGAADDGSGVAALLETARALKAGPPPARDVIFLMTDGEEDGLLGAEVFQAEDPWAGDVGLVLNFEARGTAGPSLMFESSPGNRELVAALAGVPHPRAYSFGAAIYRSMPNDTDLSVWLRAGLQGLNFAFIGRPYDYHTAGDNLARLDRRSLQHHGSSALALARRFGNDGIPPKAPADAVYFSFLGDWLIRYSRMTAFLLVGLVAVLLAAAGTIAVKRRIFRWGGLFRGLFFMLAALVLSGGLGYGFLALVREAHGAWLPAGPWIYSRTYFLAAIFLAAGATALLHGAFRAKNRGFAVAYGAAVLWLVLAAAATILAVDASYLAAGPAVFLSAGVLVWAVGRKQRDEQNTAPPIFASVVAAVGVVFIAAPVILLLFETMFLSPLTGAVLGVLVSLMLSGLAAVLEILRRGWGRGLLVLLFGLFAVFVVIAVFTVRYSGEIPRLVSLQYLRDYDSGRAFWVTRTDSLGPWTGAAAGGAFQAGHPLPENISRPEGYFFREAPLAYPAPPDVAVVEDARSDTSRKLRARISSPRGGRLIVVSVKTDKLAAAEIEGRPFVLGPDETSALTRVFINPGPEGFVLGLETAPEGPLWITVRELNPGFPELEGFAPPPAPLDIRPHRIEVALIKTFDYSLPAE